MASEKTAHNRLAKEKSPYLLQHADNPVNWYPWGEEAFLEAKKQDKPIFLSIGYSTCHWCHVMAHESFEDEDIAKKINEYFIPIKVDREERPDIDNIYMSAVMAMTGQGGWPLTAVLTPDKKPFFGGTYFPPYAKWGSPGLLDIIESLRHAWTTNRESVIKSSDALTETLRQRAKSEGGGELSKDVMDAGFQQYVNMYDAQYGGFGQSPKFPTSHNLSFLLRYWKRSSNAKALSIVEHTLSAMANGGMRDHLGGGFHRYATDQQWQIPHFEKMLYDQALLSRTYCEAYQVTKNPFYAKVAREILDYVLRDLTDAEGGFYSAEDADSLDPDSTDAHKKEGAFYLWRADEIKQALGEECAKIFNYHFGIKKNGNAHSDPHNEFTGKNIIFVEHDFAATAEHFKTTEANVATVIKEAKDKLLAIRNQRPRPHLDDKVMTDWNGLMISSLAFGAQVLDEPRYELAARRAAQFISGHMIKDNRLLHRYRMGSVGIAASHEDYAFFIHGLLDLYESNFDARHLTQVYTLAQTMVDLFWDKAQGGFYFTARDSEELLFRQKEIYDGAIPSGNSFAALDLIRLYHISFDAVWQERLEKQFQLFARPIKQHPSAYAQMMIAFDFMIGPSQEIVIAGNRLDADVQKSRKSLFEGFIPNKVIVFRPTSAAELEEVVRIAPFVKNQFPMENKATVYICENKICQKPITDFTQLDKTFKHLSQPV